MRNFSEIMALIEEKKSENIPSENEIIVTKDLFEVYKERDLDKIIMCILNGADPNEDAGIQGDGPVLLEAALDGEKEIAIALVLLGANLRNAIYLALQRSQWHSGFASAIQILFDCSLIGCEWDGKDALFFDSLPGLIKKIAEAGFGLNDLNYIGFSIDGKPLTRSMLKQKGIHLSGGIFINDDIKAVEDESRRGFLLDGVDFSLKKFGCLMDGNHFNFVSLQKAATSGNTSAVLARIAAGWHLEAGNKGYSTNFAEAIRGAVEADSPKIAEAMMSEFMAVKFKDITHEESLKNKHLHIREVFIEEEHQAGLGSKKNIIAFFRQKIEDLPGYGMERWDKRRFAYAMTRHDTALILSLMKADPGIVHSTIENHRHKGKPLSFATTGLSYKMLFDLLLNYKMEQYTFIDFYQVIIESLKVGNLEAIGKILKRTQKIEFDESCDIEDFLPLFIRANIELADKIPLYQSLADFLPLKKVSFTAALQKIMTDDSYAICNKGIFLTNEEEQLRLSQIAVLLVLVDTSKETLPKLQTMLSRYLIKLSPGSDGSEERKRYYQEMLGTIPQKFFNAQNFFETALDYKNYYVMKLALSMGADINHTTYLFTAVYKNAPSEMLKFLIDQGINVNIRKNGSTALDLANVMVEELKDHLRNQESENFEYGSYYSQISRLENKVNYLKSIIEDQQFNKELKKLCELRENNQLENAGRLIESLKSRHYFNHILLCRFVRDLVKEGDLNGINAFVAHGFNFKRSIDNEPFAVPDTVRTFSDIGFDARFEKKETGYGLFTQKQSFLDLIEGIEDQALQKQIRERMGFEYEKDSKDPTVIRFNNVR